MFLIMQYSIFDSQLQVLHAFINGNSICLNNSGLTLTYIWFKCNKMEHVFCILVIVLHKDYITTI